MMNLQKRQVHKDNFVSALAGHASHELLEVGKEYKYRDHTGPGSWTNESKRATKQHIEKTAEHLRRAGIMNGKLPYFNRGEKQEA